MYIESALHQRGYYTSGNTVQRDIIRLWGQQRDIKHVKECLSELHLPWGSVPGGECAAEFPHRMELQSEDEGGVYCTSEQIIFSAADCSPLLLSSFFSFTLSFHCNLLYLRTQFIKLVVSAGLFLLWVGLFGGTNRKEKWTYTTIISLSFSQPVCSSLLTWHLVGKDGNIVGIEASLYDRLLCLDQAMAMLWIPAPLPLWLSVLFQQQPLRPPC